MLLFQRRVPAVFDCRRCELWKLDIRQKILQRFVRGATTHDYGKSGIVGESLIRECPINTVISKIQSSFDESVDGVEAEPVLVVPVIDVKHSAKWAVCLRGKNHLSVFSTEDE